MQNAGVVDDEHYKIQNRTVDKTDNKITLIETAVVHPYIALHHARSHILEYSVNPAHTQLKYFLVGLVWMRFPLPALAAMITPLPHMTDVDNEGGGAVNGRRVYTHTFTLGISRERSISLEVRKRYQLHWLLHKGSCISHDSLLRTSCGDTPNFWAHTLSRLRKHNPINNKRVADTTQ